MPRQIGRNTFEKDAERITTFAQGDSFNANIIGAESYVEFLEQGSNPATPDSTYGRLFVNSVGQIKFINDAGLIVHVGDIYYDLPVGTGVLGGSAAILTWGTYAFSSWVLNATTNDYIEWAFRLPAGWDGRTLSYAFMWGRTVAGTGNVRFYLEAARVYDGGALPTVATVSQIQDIAVPVATDTAKLSSGSVSLAGWNNIDWINLRLGRDGAHVNDTFGGAARLLGMRISVT